MSNLNQHPLFPSTQVIICFIWLLTSPPHANNNTDHSAVIIIECVTGSEIGFWCVLGYISILACMCLLMAFFCSKAAWQFQWGKVHHLQHVDILRSVDYIYSSLCEHSWEIYCGRPYFCYFSLSFWCPFLHFCSKVLYHSTGTRKKQQEKYDAKININCTCC